MEQVIIERTHPDAKMPTKATEDSACWDVYAVHDASVSFGEITIIDLGFRIKIPKGYEIVVRPRSGLAFKHGITIINSPGTIDADYRGQMKVALTSNNSIHYGESLIDPFGDIETQDDTFKINKGDRIAQIALKKLESYEFVEGKVDNETSRGEGGFGSTGA